MGDAPEAPLDLSVVVPVFNEAGNILPLADEVARALKGVCRYELIFVDDGSSDAGAAELADAQSADHAIRVLRHTHRAGKSMALVTGFWAARAPWIQTLDGDRQNDPADVARIWKMLHASEIPPKLGIVSGLRKRRNDGAIKWLSSRIANGVRRTLLNDSTRDTGCGFKLMRRSVALKLPYFSGMHRFLPALVKRQGFETMEIPIEDRPRGAGQSKYGFFGRLGAGIFDLTGVFWLLRRASATDSTEVQS
jgi:dolichol-phosphate mannosyltransferase